MKPGTPSFSPLSIGYFSPGWPVDAIPNGVVSYVADMACQLQTLGHQVTVVAAAIRDTNPDVSIYDMQQVRLSRDLTRRVMIKLAYRIAPHWTAARESRATC